MLRAAAGAPLIEREPEPRGSVVAVEGPPDIGRSSLVAAAVELARERGMYTIGVRGTELERSCPCGVARQSADSVTLDQTPEERAALFTGAAKLALRILDVPAPARPLLADRRTWPGSSRS